MKFRNLIEENVTGILGTIIFHLVLVNLFFMIKISSLKSEKHIEIAIEFQELAEDEELLPKDEKKEFVEQEIQQFNQEMRRNIAVNKANEKLAEEISTENYVDELKKELNIDELFPENEPDENFFPKINEKKEEKKDTKNENKEYAGPTNITYELKDRDDRYMHVPVYKCQGYGKVVLDITVDQKGYVISTDVKSVSGSSSDVCLIESAIDAAKRSRFNTDYNAPNRQKGTITYLFVAQ